MFTKIVVKNPGCDFCRYFLPPFKYQSKKTGEACLKGARKIYQKQSANKRKWKWTNCSYSQEKNKNRLCRDFKIKSLIYSICNQFQLLINRADQQLPPSFEGEIWWET